MVDLTSAYQFIDVLTGTPGVGAALQKKAAVVPEQPAQVNPAPVAQQGPTISGRERWLQDRGIFPQLGGRWGAYRTGPDGTIPKNTLIHPFNAGLI